MHPASFTPRLAADRRALLCSFYPPSIFGLLAQFSPRNILVVDADANKAAGNHWPSLYWRVGMSREQRLVSVGVLADAWRMSTPDGSIPLDRLGEMARWCGLPTVWHVGSKSLLPPTCEMFYRSWAHDVRMISLLGCSCACLLQLIPLGLCCIRHSASVCGSAHQSGRWRSGST